MVVFLVVITDAGQFKVAFEEAQQANVKLSSSTTAPAGETPEAAPAAEEPETKTEEAAAVKEEAAEEKTEEAAA